MPLGLAIGMFVVLVSIVGFIHYAVSTPGLQTPAFLWGLANGVALYAIAPKIPVVGPWLVSIVEMVVNPPIPRPDWLTEDMIGWAWPAVIVLVAWLYVSKILRFRPKFSLGAGRPVASGAGRRPVQQQVG
jgi:hypothetical protein